ncbi:RusA family crossover junction endodeoxyribonuclease [Lysinibacillus sp.]|uniref:RusA family crossover junction endodeoxyribonuclease n=1 Tax=Lysinibacillus sp. TaxID=1869345 RepID=UPI0028B01EA3|nr:RusA family crossover junction endodeoxyribonuclease [Lysinibacillus sp.]
MKSEFMSFDYEQQLYEKGLNPLFGEYRQTFNIRPIPYGNRNKEQFKASVQEYFKDIHYYFYDEVKVEIDLYLNEQRRYETPDSGDLDNYAKLICDALKGKNGILIDDIQIQRLNISWIDTMKNEHFEVRIFSHPDSFILKDIEFYEMPNGLYYPISDKLWTVDGVRDVTADEKGAIQKILFEVLKGVRKKRHILHQKGKQGTEAYYEYMKAHLVLRGYNKNRLLENGFKLCAIKM